METDPCQNMPYLVAAYSAVWLVVASYLLVLLRRNKKLDQAVTVLENRLAQLEKRNKP